MQGGLQEGFSTTLGTLHYVFRTIVKLHSFRLKLFSVKCIVHHPKGGSGLDPLQGVIGKLGPLQLVYIPG